MPAICGYAALRHQKPPHSAALLLHPHARPSGQLQSNSPVLPCCAAAGPKKIIPRIAESLKVARETFAEQGGKAATRQLPGKGGSSSGSNSSPGAAEPKPGAGPKQD